MTTILLPAFLDAPVPVLPDELGVMRTIPGILLAVGLLVLLCTVIILGIKIIGNANSDHPRPLTRNVIYMVIGGIIIGAPLSILGALGLAQ